MIFQYGWEPVLIQWMLIGFEAIQTKAHLFYKVVSRVSKEKISQGHILAYGHIRLKHDKDDNIHKSEALKSEGRTNEQ